MKDKDKTTVKGGCGFLGLLTIAFIVLKLCKVISWPWLGVLAPLWVPVAIAFLIAVIIVLAND